MPIKFTGAWKSATGATDKQLTPSMIEIGTAFDSLMPLLLAGAGAAIGPAGLLIAQAQKAEDDSQIPLHLARLSPSNLFPVTVLPSFIQACTQLSAEFIASQGANPPTPASAQTAWAATLANALPGGEKLAAAMAAYLGTVVIGGVGLPSDPPAASGKPPIQDANSPAVISYEAISPTQTVRFTSHVTGDVPLVYAWTFYDPSDLIIGAAVGQTAEFNFAPFGPTSTTFKAKLTACNFGGTLENLRDDISSI